MVWSMVFLGCATTVAAQFQFVHTQYETSPPVYPPRESIMLEALVTSDRKFSENHRHWGMGGSTREGASICWKSESRGEG
jgi:hypothetical protein